MKIDIWSDVRCPFCYIGKKHLEEALEKFPERDKVEIEWHSFQLDPKLETTPETSTLDYFVQVKNVSPEQAKEMFRNTRKMGADVGLDMELEKAVVANSQKAHELIQFAKQKGKANQLEEELFKAHFTEGRNIDDEEALVAIASSAGLDPEEAREAIKNDNFSYAVKQDEMQAQKIGVRGVPFFVFENKYGVSGAQPIETFSDILEKVQAEIEK